MYQGIESSIHTLGLHGVVQRGRSPFVRAILPISLMYVVRWYHHMNRTIAANFAMRTVT
jgi:hypothetical protein